MVVCLYARYSPCLRLGAPFFWSLPPITNHPLTPKEPDSLHPQWRSSLFPKPWHRNADVSTSTPCVGRKKGQAPNAGFPGWWLLFVFQDGAGPPKKNDPYKWSVINPINGFPCLFLDNPYKWSVTNPLNGLRNGIIWWFFHPDFSGVTVFHPTFSFWWLWGPPSRWQLSRDVHRLFLFLQFTDQKIWLKSNVLPIHEWWIFMVKVAI